MKHLRFSAKRKIIWKSLCSWKRINKMRKRVSRLPKARSKLETKRWRHSKFLIGSLWFNRLREIHFWKLLCNTRSRLRLRRIFPRLDQSRPHVRSRIWSRKVSSCRRMRRRMKMLQFRRHRKWFPRGLCCNRYRTTSKSFSRRPLPIVRMLL